MVFLHKQLHITSSSFLLFLFLEGYCCKLVDDRQTVWGRLTGRIHNYYIVSNSCEHYNYDCCPCRFVLQWSKISNLFISILGIIASIIGLAIMSDWQAITRDPCLNYSLYHNPELVTNMSIGSSSFSPPPTCWNKTQLREHGDIVYDVTNAMVIDGHLVFYYYPLMNNDVMVNCRVHVSTSTCYICKNSSDLTSHVELHFKNTQGEICYNPSFTKFNNQATSSLKFSVICGKSDSTCLSLCLHVHQDSHDTAAIQGTAETEGDTRQLFHHAYTKSLLLLQEFLYDSARNTCESETTARCHWIPHSLVTHKTCRDCQPICRGLSHTMTFIQFVAGSIWFMLTYPVAEVALPVVISDSTQNDYQVSMVPSQMLALQS